MKKSVNIMQYGIYLNHQKAVLISIDGENKLVTEEWKMPVSPARFTGEATDKTGLFSHTLGRQPQRQAKTQNEFKKFCKFIAGKLKNANQVYIFGPADGKYFLYREIEGRKSMAHVYVEIGTSDKMTKAEVVRTVKEHFRAFA